MGTNLTHCSNTLTWMRDETQRVTVRESMYLMMNDGYRMELELQMRTIISKIQEKKQKFIPQNPT